MFAQETHTARLVHISALRIVHQTNITYQITCNNTSEGKTGLISHLKSHAITHWKWREKKEKKGEKTAGLELGSWVGKKFGKTPLFI